MKTECSLSEQYGYKECEGVILEPLSLSASIIRNISLPNRAFPNVDIKISLDAIKVCTYFCILGCTTYVQCDLASCKIFILVVK